MKKAAVTLESLDKKIETSIETLDKKIETLDKKIETSIESLDKKIDMIDFKFEKKIDLLDKKIEGNTFEIRQMSKEFVDFVNFMKENVMLRDETKDRINERVDTKFTKYTSDQFEFQDHVGKRCENVEHETLVLQHRVTLIEKHLDM
jgi:hypothetical protein